MPKQQRRELAHAAVAIIEKREVVKFLRLGKGLRLGDGRFKLGPWQHGFDGGERIATPGTRLDQSLTDRNVQPHLFVDRFPARVKLLRMHTFRFLEQLSDQMLEHIQCLIGQCRREIQCQGRERGVATQRFELCQVLYRTLAALPGELKPIVLVNPSRAFRLDTKRPNLIQPVYQFGKLPVVAA
jgi:hypothetical protein